MCTNITEKIRNLFIYLFINYNTITNYILIIYEMSNIDHLLGVVSQTRVSGGNRNDMKSFFFQSFKLSFQCNLCNYRFYLKLPSHFIYSNILSLKHAPKQNNFKLLISFIKVIFIKNYVCFLTFYLFLICFYSEKSKPDLIKRMSKTSFCKQKFFYKRDKKKMN